MANNKGAPQKPARTPAGERDTRATQPPATHLPPERKACGNCAHFERFPDDGHPVDEDPHGECLRYPPTVHGYDEDETPMQSLPVVSFWHRCGEHTLRMN